MRLEIQLFAVLKERAGADTVVLDDVPEGTTVGDVKSLVMEACPAIGSLDAVAGVVGTTYAGDMHVIQSGDSVALLPPVSGGAPGGPDREAADLNAGVFELAADPIDVAALQARVAHPTCGAIVVFTGTTRDTNRGQDVSELDYEAFEAMTGPEMGRIFLDCVAAHGPASSSDGVDRSLRMLCVHRTGVVGVGEPSVVIAVASPHRDAAFLAARFLIDTLKERLPIWKKEVYGAGHHWIGDRS